MHPLYAELKEAGRGPHATVYRARDPLLGRDVAVKELANWADRPLAALARLRFAGTQAHLHHPHLLAGHIADAERGRLATDFFAEGSLADRIARDGPLSPIQVRQVLLDALEALVHLHGHGLLHGAVKPSNLFVDSQGVVFLADGVGLALAENRSLPAYPQPITPQDEKYLAPEGAQAFGPKAELYSLGLTLLELLLGNDFELLFPEVLGRALTWTEWHRSDRQLPPVQTLVPGLPRQLATVLDRLVRKQPQERYESAAEALESVRPAPHGYRRWGGPALVAGACAGVVVLAALLLVRPWEVVAGAAAHADQLAAADEKRVAAVRLAEEKSKLAERLKADLDKATKGWKLAEKERDLAKQQAVQLAADKDAESRAAEEQRAVWQVVMERLKLGGRRHAKNALDSASGS
jgi:hypothetical protein